MLRASIWVRSRAASICSAGVALPERDATVPYSASEARRSRLVIALWPPRGRRVFPLVVGKLPQAGAVGPHHKKFSIGLRYVFRKRRFVFETHPRTAEYNPLAVRRPNAMAIIAPRIRQAAQIGAVGLNGVDLKVTVTIAGECDAVSLGRPLGKVVVVRA